MVQSKAKEDKGHCYHIDSLGLKWSNFSPFSSNLMLEPNQFGSRCSGEKIRAAPLSSLVRFWIFKIGVERRIAFPF